jgi:hypothetical protein
MWADNFKPSDRPRDRAAHRNTTYPVIFVQAEAVSLDAR